MNEPAPNSDSPEMDSMSDLTRTRVFISYARIDAEFVDRLEEQLKARKFIPLIDRREIEDFELWRERIKELIVSCDVMIFVISPDAVRSPHCEWEVYPVGCRIAA
jgi:hypothetical protein